jgi:hypothetical protein
MVTQTGLNVYGLSCLNITAGGRLYGPMCFQKLVKTEISYHQQHTISNLKYIIRREEVFTTMDAENAVFWDMTPCSLVHYKIKHSGKQQF